MAASLTRWRRAVRIVLAAPFFLLATAAIVACPQEHRPEPTARPPNRPAPLHLAAPPMPKYFTEALTGAIALIHRAEPSFLAEDEGVLFQTSPPQGKRVGLAVFFVTHDAGAPQQPSGVRRIPEVCAAINEPLELRFGPEERASFDGKSPRVILCNLNFILKLEASIRLFHSDEYIARAFASDRAYMAAQRERPALGAKTLEGSPVVELASDHMANHWLFPLTFVLAHEVHHGMLGETNHDFEGEIDRAAPVKPSGTLDMRTRALCRNYDEYQRQGWDLWSTHPEARSLADESRDAGASVEAALSVSRRIWASELAADRFAERVVAGGLQALGKLDVAERDARDVRDYFLEAMAFIVMNSWYERMHAFVAYPCSKFAESDHILTRCLCERPDHYRSIGTFFEETHPPLYLRAARVFREMVGKGMPTTTGHTRRIERVLLALNDTALKLAEFVCLAPVLLRGVKPDGHVVTDYSSLEGLAEAPDEHRFPGTPSIAKRQEISRENCGGAPLPM